MSARRKKLLAALAEHPAELLALMCSIMMPQEFPVVRSPFATSRPTAAISPFAEFSIPWDVTNPTTAGKDWFDVKQWACVQTRDPRSALIYWDPNQAMLPDAQSWQFSGTTTGNTLYSPEMPAGDWFPVMATKHAGTYQPIAAGGLANLEVAHIDEDGVPLAQCWTRLNSTANGTGTPAAGQIIFYNLANNTWYQFSVRYVWGGVRIELAIQLQSGGSGILGITLQDGASGYYGVQYVGTGGTAGAFGTFVANPLGQGTIQVNFTTGTVAGTGTGKMVQCIAPWLVYLGGLADGVRVHANALLISNIMPKEGKSGEVLAYQVPPGNSWIDYIGSSYPNAVPQVTDFFGVIASNMGREQKTFTDGADAWLPYGQQDQWNFVDCFATNEASASGTNAAAGGIQLFNRIPVNTTMDTQIIVVKASGTQTLYGPQDCLATWTTGLEMETDAPIFRADVAEIGPIQVMDAQFRMRRAPRLTGNPIHVKDLFNYARTAAKLLLPAAAGVGTYFATEGNVSAAMAAGSAASKLVG